MSGFLLSGVQVLQGKTRLFKKVWRTDWFAVKYHWLFTWGTGVNWCKCISIQISIVAIILFQMLLKPKADHKKVNFDMQVPTVRILSNKLQKRMKSTDFFKPLRICKAPQYREHLCLNFSGLIYNCTNTYPLRKVMVLDFPPTFFNAWTFYSSKVGWLDSCLMSSWDIFINTHLGEVWDRQVRKEYLLQSCKEKLFQTLGTFKIKRI